MRELHMCHICKRTFRLAHDTLHSTEQTNIGKCVLHVLKNTPQAGMNSENTTEKKIIYSINKTTICVVIDEHN